MTIPRFIRLPWTTTIVARETAVFFGSTVGGLVVLLVGLLGDIPWLIVTGMLVAVWVVWDPRVWRGLNHSVLAAARKETALLRERLRQ